MIDDQSSKGFSEERGDAEETSSPTIRPISLQPFAVQPLDIIPVEIVAKRFPALISNLPSSVNVQFNIQELGVDAENLQAQVTLDVQVESAEEPRLFEIHFKLVAFFAYDSEYSEEMVSQFLQQGSLSVMLPFARELVLSLSTRLHLPPIVLSLVQLTAPSTPE